MGVVGGYEGSLAELYRQAGYDVSGGVIDATGVMGNV